MCKATKQASMECSLKMMVLFYFYEPNIKFGKFSP